MSAEEPTENAPYSAAHWAEIRASKKSGVTPPPDWPRGVTPITIGAMDLFGLDEEERLYYDGKMVEVRRRLDLSRGEKWFAGVVGFFTILGGVGAVAQGWAAAHQWSCQIEAVSWHCPKK